MVFYNILGEPVKSRDFLSLTIKGLLSWKVVTGCAKKVPSSKDGLICLPNDLWPELQPNSKDIPVDIPNSNYNVYNFFNTM